MTKDPEQNSMDKQTDTIIERSKVAESSEKKDAFKSALRQVNDPIAMSMWAYHPDAKNYYPDIAHDELLGNLKTKDYENLIELDRFIGLLNQFSHVFGNIIPVFVRERKIRVILSNSIKGFGRILLMEENVNIKRHNTDPQPVSFLDRVTSSFRPKN